MMREVEPNIELFAVFVFADWEQAQETPAQWPGW